MSPPPITQSPNHPVTGSPSHRITHFRRGGFFLILLAVAAGLRLWRIDSLPPGFHFDESFEGLEAWRILTDPSYRPLFLEGNFGVPVLNAYANALTFGLFRLFSAEVGPTAMRVTAAVFGVLGVAAVYGLADELRRRDEWLPPAFPFLAAGALAGMRWHIHFSRMGIEPITVPLLWALAFWLWLRAWRTGSLGAFAGAGLVFAATLYAYQGAWIVPFLALPLVAHLTVTDRARLSHRWPGLLLAGGLALLLVLPLLLFFSEHPDLLLLRPQQVNVVGATGSPADASLWANLGATAKMFGPFGAPGDLDPRRNLPGAPALNLWLAIPFYLGLLIALLRVRRPAYSLLLISLVGLLLPGIVTEYAPHFHRILGASAPTALLIGLGLSALILPKKSADFADGRRFALPLRVSAPLRYSLLSLAVFLLGAGGVTSARNYFVRWASLPDLYYAFDEGLWDLGRWIAAQPAATPLYLTPRTADHPTLAFALARTGRPGPVSFDGRHIFPLTAGAAPTAEHYVVIEHEDFRTRLLLPEVLPEAQVSREFLDRRGEVYARVYTRTPGSVAQRPPQHVRDVPLGDGIRLLGYDTLPATPQPGGVLYLQLHWLVEERPQVNWTIFTHLLGSPQADGSRLWAGKDARPGAGSLSTDRWQAGWRVLDEYQIPLPGDLPPGEYELEIGLYTADGARLPPDGSGVRLGAVRIGE